MVPLRPGLLSGQTIALAAEHRPALAARLVELGAELCPAAGASCDDETAAAWARQHLPLSALVLAAQESAAGEPPERVLEAGWTLLRAVAAEALIGPGQPGKLVLVAPRPGSVQTAASTAAVRAAVENLARTLSVEWARHAVTVTAVAPGARTDEGEVADLVAYLLSPAGDYFSGCRFELGALR